MQRNSSLSVFLICAALLFQLAAQEQVVLKPGEQVVQTLATSDGQSINYLIFLPKEYDAASNTKHKTWPLMIFMHGAGERGSDIELVKKWGPPKLVGNDQEFPFVLVSPQCPSGQRWNPDYVNQLVDHVVENLHIDKQRIYVTGLSMGGFGTWSLIAAHPDKFAAAAPICGGGDTETAKQLTKIPIWAFHGDADSVVPLSASSKMVDAIKANGGTRVKLTVYEGVGHNSWSQTYANKKLYEWMLKHRLTHK